MIRRAPASADSGRSPYRETLRCLDRYQPGAARVEGLLVDCFGRVWQACCEQMPQEEQFIAACARADSIAAVSIQSMQPNLPRALSQTQLQLLPELAAQGCSDAVKIMVELGWPVAVKGGDWNASALNHAVFRGDAALTQLLLDHGASWAEEHGFGDNACGTLAWASCNEPVQGGNWLGCAKALVKHGMPTAERDPASTESVIIDGRRKRFSDEVTEWLLKREGNTLRQ